MDIELTQQQATSLTNEGQLSQHDLLTSATTSQQSETNPLSKNLVFAVENSSGSQASNHEQQQDVAINIHANSGPNSVVLLSDAGIVNNIIETMQRNGRRQCMYLFGACVPFIVIMSVLWIIWTANICSSKDEYGCGNRALLHLFCIALTIMTGALLFVVIIRRLSLYANRKRYNMLRNSVRCIVKLEGDKWTSYVNYLYGPNRGSFRYVGHIGSVLFWARKSHYKKLVARGYGYIIFCQQGLILDEMYHIVRDEPHAILKVEYIINLGLRVYLLRTDGKYTVHRSWSEEIRQQAALQAAAEQIVPFDIFLPNTIPERAAVLLALQVQHGL
jgi:hypothetical protein